MNWGETMSETAKYIIFKLREQSFAVDIHQVISIERLQKLTEVPRTSKFIKGVTQIRDVTTPIIDLKERLYMPESEVTDDFRILVIQFNEMQIGLIIDAAEEVKDIANSAIQPAPPIIGGVKQTFVKGIAKLEEELLIILELETILNAEEISELEKVID